MIAPILELRGAAMSITYDSGTVEEPNVQVSKIRKSAKLMRGLRALEREYEEFVELSRQAAAQSLERKRT